jgi:hypothetical protein
MSVDGGGMRLPPAQAVIRLMSSSPVHNDRGMERKLLVMDESPKIHVARPIKGENAHLSKRW